MAEAITLSFIRCKNNFFCKKEKASLKKEAFHKKKKQLLSYQPLDKEYDSHKECNSTNDPKHITPNN